MNKIVVITGATSGIGKHAAEELAARGARIIQIARNRVRGEAAVKRLRAISPGVAHAIYYADLSKMIDTRRVALEIAAKEPRIDVVINNAGAVFSSRQVTEDGLERTFALNHLAYFALMHYLLPQLKSSAPARIINTASDAHESAVLDFDDLQSEKAYKGTFLEFVRYGGPGFKVYGRSKLCNILFTRELAKRLQGTGVTANSFHPGFVSTRFADEAGGVIALGTKIAKRFARPIDKGAETLIFLADSPDVRDTTGQYFHDCHTIPASVAAQDDVAAARLWHESCRLTNIPD